MTYSSQLINEISSNKYNQLLTDIYIDSASINYQKQRYIAAIVRYEQLFGSGDVEIYSAPGRSEIGGNHTDHQHGEVLATSINQDIIAIVSKTNEPYVQIVSDQNDMISLNLDSLEKNPDEEGTTTALIKGILSRTKELNYNIGGFKAYLTSDVLIGAGLSSSAAFETVIGSIISGLYNNMKISPVDIAFIGQYAENEYFGKPCGLMDQMASSIGNMIHINFKEPKNPIVNRIDFHMEEHGYSLCIVNTKGSHSDLTADYAAIPKEMKAVAACFDKEVLSEVKYNDVLSNINLIRNKVNDRAVLRAIHFFEENMRVIKEVEALKSNNIAEFLELVKLSGNSSFKYLQNIYTNNDVAHQNISIALATSDCFLGENGVSRIHGGGFAGTIQTFVKNDFVNDYKRKMEEIFGVDSCTVLKVRKYGGIKVL